MRAGTISSDFIGKKIRKLRKYDIFSKKCFIQVAYLLSSDDVIEREFGAFDSVRDSSPKYVFSLDEYDMSKDGITHFNIED